MRGTVDELVVPTAQVEAEQQGDDVVEQDRGNAAGQRLVATGTIVSTPARACSYSARVAGKTGVTYRAAVTAAAESLPPPSAVCSSSVLNTIRCIRLPLLHPAGSHPLVGRRAGPEPANRPRDRPERTLAGVDGIIIRTLVAPVGQSLGGRQPARASRAVRAGRRRTPAVSIDRTLNGGQSADRGR